MKTTELKLLETPRRQSPIAIALILLKLFKTLLKQAWPLALVMLFNRQSSSWIYFIYIAIGAAVISAIASIISYFKFYFYIKDGELVIEKGLLQKTKLNIPFDRIQTINFKQNIIHQAFQVVNVEIDTAGSVQKEFSITALEKDQAERLRDFVMQQKEKAKPLEVETEEAPLPTQVPDQLIFRLLPLDLIKVGVGQNHLRTVGILLATLYGIFQFSEDIFGKKETDQLLGSVIGTELNAIITTLLLIVPFFLLVAFAGTLITTVLKYFNLQFYRTEQGFKTVAGLFTRREQSTTVAKLQWIRWSTNPLMRLFKQYRMQLSAAASQVINTNQAMSVPGCYMEQVERVRQVYFPEFTTLKKETHGISKAIIGRHMLYFSWPVPLIGAFVSSGFNVNDLLWLLWIPFVYLLSRRFHAKWKFHVNSEGLQTDKGIFGSQATLLKWYKIQSVQLRQTPYQKRKQLTNVHFYTAAGRVSIPYIQLSDAQRLRDYVLYKIESDQRKWM